MEEWGVERRLGRKYDECYRVFDHCIAECCVNIVVWLYVAIEGGV